MIDSEKRLFLPVIYSFRVNIPNKLLDQLIITRLFPTAWSFLLTHHVITGNRIFDERPVRELNRSIDFIFRLTDLWSLLESESTFDSHAGIKEMEKRLHLFNKRTETIFINWYYFPVDQKDSVKHESCFKIRRFPEITCFTRETMPVHWHVLHWREKSWHMSHQCLVSCVLTSVPVLSRFRLYLLNYSWPEGCFLCNITLTDFMRLLRLLLHSRKRTRVHCKVIGFQLIVDSVCGNGMWMT